MAVISKLVDMSSLATLESRLQHLPKDDVALLALLLFSGFFYTFFFKDKSDPYHYLWFEKPQTAGSEVRAAETRDIGQKLEESNKDIVVFWGSQSGTAEGLANRLVRDCRRRYDVDALAADLSDYDPQSIANIKGSKFAIFIISTYGEGDPSDNSMHFLSWLDLNKAVNFPNLRYAAFGLGNSKYKFYNRVIDVVVEALERSEATALMPTGKADDSNGSTDEDFTEWRESLFSVFRHELGFEERPSQYEPSLQVVEDTSLDIIDLHHGEPIEACSKKGTTATSTIQAFPIKSARKLLSTIDRNCLHVDLDVGEFAELKYKTGDHLAVWPVNPKAEVKRLVQILGLKDSLDTPLLVRSLDPSIKTYVPSPTTWTALLNNYLEICAPVPREIVLSLAQFASSSASIAILKRLGEDKNVYHTHCLQNHVTLGRLLESTLSSEENWTKLPLSFVLESLGPLLPRYYSISSSSIVAPKQISITVATSSEAPSPFSISVPGLATTYLTSLAQMNPSTSDFNLSGPNNTLQNGTKLYAQVRTSKFRLPALPKNPVILIASGSGMAPFLGFLQERSRLSTIGRAVGPSLLLFGCRSPSEFLYHDELRALESTNEGMEIISAFSREGQKKYVQDRLEERDEDIIRLLTEENAYLYICGSAAMARDVAERLGECLMRRLDWDAAKLRSWSEGIRRGHRWQEDVWG